MLSASARPRNRLVDWFTFDRLLTTLAFAAISAAALLMPAQNDTWWHLRSGQAIWTTGRVLLQDTFSFTANGAFWPNHEWGSQLLFYALHAIGGLPLLTVACAAAVIAAWAIVWQLAPVPPRVKFLLVAWVLGSATTAWTLRPQVISQLMVAVVVALIVRRKYLWLPPIFVLWANLHGAVLTGIVLLAASTAAAWVSRDRGWPRLGASAALCLLATLATPIGWHLWREIPAFFIRIRQVRVEEFTAPRFTPLWIPFWSAAVALIVFAALRGPALLRDDRARSRGEVTLCACALALLAMAVTAVRNVGPFLLIAMPALAVLIPPAWTTRARPRVEQPRLNLAAACATAAIVCGVVVSAYARGAERLRWAPLPAASFQALDACRGNVYNRFDEGGYLIWFAPDRPVFIDSRYLPYSDAFIQEHVRIERTGDVEPALRQYDIHCAYLPSGSLVGQRLRAAGWATLYQDARWTVLGESKPNLARAGM